MASNRYEQNLTEMISVVFTPYQHRALELAAMKDSRKVGNYIRHVVVRTMEVSGIMDELDRILEQEEAAQQAEETAKVNE